MLTFVIYLPSLFRYEVVKCVADGSITYYKRDNSEFLQTLFYSVSEWKNSNIF